MLMLPFTILSVACTWHITLGYLTGMFEPKVNNVLEGGSAEFVCTVTSRDKQNEDIGWLFFYEFDTKVRLWQYSVTSNFTFGDFNTLNINYAFENKTIVYNSSYVEERFTLRIINATKTDEHYKFLCIYWREQHGQRWQSVFDSGIVVVWTTPSSQPQCQYDGDIPNIIQGQEHFNISLTCSLNDGDPLPLLAWYTINETDLTPVAGSATSSLRVFQTITAFDHGREFICQADIAAIPDESLICSVIPYIPKPQIDVVSDKLIYEMSEPITILCNNTGLSTADTIYLWYIEKVLIDVSQIYGLSVEETMSSSTLFILDYFFSTTTVEVTCEVVVPTVSTANKSLVITIVESSSTTTTSSIDSSSAEYAACSLTESWFQALIAITVIGWCLFAMPASLSSCSTV